MRQLILDTETTGLDPVKGHKIIEFAALEMIDRQLTGSSLHLYINPEREIDEGASRIHGITDKDVRGKPVFDAVAPQIIDFIKDSELIIHNAKFDIGFLDFQLKQVKLGLVAEYVAGVIDTLMLARRKFPGGRNSLDALCDRFKVDRSVRDYHGALIDCKLLADVYLNLTREQISLLEDERLAKQQNKFKFKKIKTLTQEVKIVMATPEEEHLHQKYLAELDKLSKGNCEWFNHDKANHNGS